MQVADAIYEREIVSELYSTSGEYDLWPSYTSRRRSMSGHYINERLLDIPGITRSLTTMTFKRLLIQGAMSSTHRAGPPRPQGRRRRPSRRRSAGQLSGHHIAQRVGHLGGRLGHRLGGGIDLFQRMGVFGRMQHDQRRAQRHGIACIEGRVPLPVFLAKADDDDIGLLDSVRVRIAFNSAPLRSCQTLLSSGPRQSCRIAVKWMSSPSQQRRQSV
jgi:hypothetical protein